MPLEGKDSGDEESQENVFNFSDKITKSCEICLVNQLENQEESSHLTSHKTKSKSSHEVNNSSHVGAETTSSTVLNNMTKHSKQVEDEGLQENAFNFPEENTTPCQICSGNQDKNKAEPNNVISLKAEEQTTHKVIKPSHIPNKSSLVSALTEKNLPELDSETNIEHFSSLKGFTNPSSIDISTQESTVDDIVENPTENDEGTGNSSEELTDIDQISSQVQTSESATQKSTVEKIIENPTETVMATASEPQSLENEGTGNTSEELTDSDQILSQVQTSESTNVKTNMKHFTKEVKVEITGEKTSSVLQSEHFDKFDHTSPDTQTSENVEVIAGDLIEINTEKSIDKPIETLTTINQISSKIFSLKEQFLETQNEFSSNIPNNKSKSTNLNINEEIKEYVFNFSDKKATKCEKCFVTVTEEIHLSNKRTKNMLTDSPSRSNVKHAIGSNSFNLVENTTEEIDHSEPLPRNTESTIHIVKTQTTESVLLTETKLKVSSEQSEPDEMEDMKAVLTEMGVSNEEFVMHTVTEKHKEEPHSTFHKTETEYFSTDKQLIGATKPVVFIVNNTGKKLKKLNETVLNNILNKAMDRNVEEVNLEYLDLHKVDKDPVIMKNENPYKNSSTTSRNEILNNVLSASRNKHCKLKDFNTKKQCLCKVDSYLNILENMLGKININEHDCADFINLHDGIIISNNTEPSTKTKRSLLFLANNQANSKVIEADIENIFSEDYQINQTDREILALPDTSLKILCHNKADLLLENKGVTYTWILTRYSTENEEVMHGGDMTFPIYKLEAKDAGNYTCKKTLSNGESEKYVHELEIVTFPVYKIEVNIFYVLRGSCSLSDGDVLYSYLPIIFDTLLCGQSSKICSVTIDRPLCTSNDDDNILNVTATAAMNSITKIFNSEIQNCDINCEMKAYDNLVTLTYKNAEILRKVHVFSRLETNIDFLTNTTNRKIQSPLPRLIITCKGGFGIEKTKQRVCVLCPQHTFSQDDEAFCRVCPIGQYQPTAGSISCVPCESPVDDIRCLQMLYSDTVLFKIYVGVAFGFCLLLIMIITFWKASGNMSEYKKVVPFEGSQRQRALRRRTRDVEKGALKPLLKNKKDAKINSPPKVPPPDF